jgi:hypothetical protein
MQLSCVSSRSRNFFIPWTHFRSGSGTWTAKEEFIVGWARELPTDQFIRIIVHFPKSDTQNKAAQDLPEAFHRYFSYRASVLQRDLTELFRIGRRSLGIGVIVLIVCFAIAHAAGESIIDSPLRRMIEESFLILGWVANWRPLEIFLYDWWSIARRRDLYQRLSKAIVEVKPYGANQPNKGAAVTRFG